MMTPFHIQQLASADIGLMRRLLNLYGRVFDEIPVYCEQQPSDDYLQRLLNKQSFITLVAMQDEELVAGLCAYELEKFEQQRSEIYIYDLVYPVTDFVSFSESQSA
ncbi:MAG: hypothetical protein Tsb002_33760 [Wenzhouxiangellaceae bacterium]